MIALSPTFAYLDPGSGSALVGTLIALAGAGLFSLKSLVYRLLRKEPLADFLVKEAAV